MTENPIAKATAHGALLALCNIWDAGTARLLESSGATIVATTSAGVAWSLGYRDGESLPVGKLLERVREITRVLERSCLSVDIEGGYSDKPADIAALVRELCDAGVRGINIEDGTREPQRLCEAIAAIRGQVSADEVHINARTDVVLRSLCAPHLQEHETLERAELYLVAGADGLFVPGLSDPAAIVRMVAAIPVALNVMAVPGLPSADELRALGVRRLSTGPWSYLAAMSAQCDYAAHFQTTATTLPTGDGLLSFSELDSRFPEG